MVSRERLRPEMDFALLEIGAKTGLDENRAAQVEVHLPAATLQCSLNWQAAFPPAFQPQSTVKSLPLPLNVELPHPEWKRLDTLIHRFEQAGRETAGDRSFYLLPKKRPGIWPNGH